MSKPTVVVLGGLGFLGRRMVEHLVRENLADAIRVVDKAVKQTAYLDAAAAAVFTDPRVTVIQANLSSEAGAGKALAPFPGDRQPEFVFNLAGESKYGQDDTAYTKGIVDLTRLCATAAKAAGVRMFIQVSTAQVYSGSSDKPKKETADLKPWTKMAAAHAQAERLLKEIALPHAVLRMPFVYGVGDRLGLFPRILCAAVYRRLGEKYRVLWSSSLKMHTLHVIDACRACWHAATRLPPSPAGALFNVVDQGDTDQGKFNRILATIFKIETDFFGTIASNLAKLNFAGACEMANEKHTEPWTQMCTEAGITSTPLLSYIDQELLYDNHISLNAEAFASTGFTLAFPAVNESLIRECIQVVIDQNIFPRSALPV